MRYTIWSRGQLVGETNLDFSPIEPRQRSGEFLPTAYGETLIPAASPEDLPPDVQVTTSLCADLELRGPDGFVIPAERIEIRDAAFTCAVVCPNPLIIQDFARFRPNAPCDDLPDDLGIEEWEYDEEPEFLDDLDFDFEEFEHGIEAPAAPGLRRYEVDVILVDDSAIP